MAGSFTWVLSVLIVDSRVVLEQGEPRPAGWEEALQPWEASEAGGELHKPFSGDFGNKIWQLLVSISGVYRSVTSPRRNW